MKDYHNELKSAIKRLQELGFLNEPIVVGGSPKISRNVHASLSAAVFQAWPRHAVTNQPMPAAGMCLPLAVKLLPVVRLFCGDDVRITLGWVYDLERKAGFWRSSPSTIIEFLAIQRQIPMLLEVHAWFSLNTGEGIDVSAYPTLACLYPNRFSSGANRYAVINKDGISSSLGQLPSFQYHPQFVLDDHMTERLAVWGDKD